MVNNNDVVVVNSDKKNDEKQPKSKFGRFVKANKGNLIAIFILLVMLGSLLFTYLHKKAVSNREEVQTTESVCVSSLSLPKNALFKEESVYLYPLESPNESTMYVSLLNANQYYTFVTWSTGEQLQAKYDDDLDVFTFYLYTAAYNGANQSERFTIAIYDTTTQDFELTQANISLNILNFSNTNSMYLNTYSGVDYTTFFTTKAPSYTGFNFTNTYTWLISDTTDSYKNAFDNGETYGKALVIDNPEEYDLVTKSDYLQYGLQQYDAGKDYGFSQSENYNFRTLIFSVLEAPAKALDMFNFELFGINVKSIVTFLITLALVIFVVGLFKKG